MNIFETFSLTDVLLASVTFFALFYLVDLVRGKKSYPMFKAKGVSNYEHHMAWINSLDDAQRAVELERLNKTVSQVESLNKLFGK